MKIKIRAVVSVLSVVSVGVFTMSLCMGETLSPSPAERAQPPARTFRRPPGSGLVPRARPIEGGNYYWELAEVHTRYGVYGKAVEMLEMAIEKETDPGKKTRYYESLSEVYRMKGETKKAAGQIEKALEVAKTVEEKCRYYTILGRICEQAKDLEGAKKAYEFVVANATRDVQKRSAELSLFRLYQKSGELENVIADLQKRLEANPGDEDALRTLAQILNSVVRKPERALPVYEKLSKLKPKDATILNRLVHFYQMNKEYEKAAGVYEKIIEASPSGRKSYYYQHVGRMYMLAGKKEEAIKWAEKSLSEGPASPYTYVSIAQLYLQNNLAEKAVQLYEKAMEASRRPIEKHQISLRFADLFAQNNEEDKAEEIYKYVMKEATVPTFKSQARSKLIALYREQGKTSEIQALTGEEQESPTPRE